MHIAVISDKALDQGFEHSASVESGIVADEHRGLRDPRGEEATPRVLGPAGRADVPVLVAGPEPGPVQRREVPDGVTLVGVAEPQVYANAVRQLIPSPLKKKTGSGRVLHFCDQPSSAASSRSRAAVQMPPLFVNSM